MFFSKESLLEFLLDRTICETASHIRNLKDVKTLKLTPNPGYDKHASGTAQEYYDTQAAKFVCPIVGMLIIFLDSSQPILIQLVTVSFRGSFTRDK